MSVINSNFTSDTTKLCSKIRKGIVTITPDPSSLPMNHCLKRPKLQPTFFNISCFLNLHCVFYSLGVYKCFIFARYYFITLKKVNKHRHRRPKYSMKWKYLLEALLVNTSSCCFITTSLSVMLLMFPIYFEIYLMLPDWFY